ncbi:TPA: hypothetical protein ACX6O9_000063 [Photobacterium damselae]
MKVRMLINILLGGKEAMVSSALLKIKRAEKHYSELANLLATRKAYRYFVETNFKTGMRATFSKKDQGVVDEAAVIIGDVVHNLRAAIDHIYWDCTSEFAKSDGERRNIQFPITSNKEAFDKSIRPGLPVRVSELFADALGELKPYRENGNNLLCAIHDLDVMDKHKLLIPTGNFTKITSAVLQQKIPDFPSGLVNCGVGNGNRDVAWNVKPMTWTQRRKAKIPPSNIIEQEVDVPVDLVLNGLNYFVPVLDSLSQLINVAKEVVDKLEVAAKEQIATTSP